MNKELLKMKNFIFPSYLIEIIPKFNLSTNEVLLLMYFLNGNLVFNLDNIKQDLKFNDQEIMVAFNNLMNKNIIKIETTKDELGKREELINLDYLYNEIILIFNNVEKDTIKNDIFSIFEREFGRPISSMEYEIIRAWIEKGFTEEIILGALKEAIYNGVSNLRYIDKILHEWQRKGYKTMKDVNKNNGSNIKEKEQIDPLYDYDWLNDDNE